MAATSRRAFLKHAGATGLAAGLAGAVRASLIRKTSKSWATTRQAIYYDVATDKAATGRFPAECEL